MTFPLRIIKPLSDANTRLSRGCKIPLRACPEQTEGATPEQTIESVPWSLKVDL